MKSVRYMLGYLAPSTLQGVFWKTVVFCGLIVGWNFVWTRYLSGQAPRPLASVVADALVVGGPFVLLFTLASWDQVRTIRNLVVRARIDPLSGVLNRQTFFEQLRKAIPQARTGLLLLMDADDFKRINDLHGHAAGDRCIAAIGHRLSWHLRQEDMAGRVGGEEFAVFLPNVPREHGEVVAARLGQPVSFTDAEQKVHHSVTLSVGAVWTSPDRSPEEQLLLADQALYEAKSTGRARMIFVGSSEPVLLGQFHAGDRPARQPIRPANSRLPAA